MGLKKIRIAQWGQIHSLYLPLYTADRLGLFEEEGLRLELHLAGNDDEVFDWVARGDADFGVGDPSFCAMESMRAVEAKIVATLVVRAGVWGLTRSPVIHEIEGVEDLVNLRIGSLPRPATTFALIQNVKLSNKRLLKSMSIVEAPIGKQFSLLAKGEADIILDIEPFVSIAEEKGCRAIYSLANFHGPYAFTGFYARQSFLETHTPLAVRTLRALKKAHALLLSDASAAQMVSRQLFPGVSDAVIKRSVQRLKAEKVWGDSLATCPEAWKNAISLRKSIGERFVADTNSVIDNSFL